MLHHEPAVLVDVLGSWRVIRAYPAADETTHTATARARGGFPPGVVRRAAVDGGARKRQPVEMTTSFFSLYGPPLTTGDEKALLHTHLRLNREALLWKLEGLSEADRRRPLTPTGTTLVGLVKHLTGVEGAYFCDAFGRPRPPLAWESDEDALMGEFSDMYAKPDETTDEIVAAYRAATAAADVAIDELELDAPGRHHLGITVSLRWMLFTVLLDTARHAGHADIVRELIDGSAGSYREWPGVAPADDEQYRETYLARVRGEIDDRSWYEFLRARRRDAT